jgi:hypothetical protein
MILHTLGLFLLSAGAILALGLAVRVITILRSSR